MGSFAQIISLRVMASGGYPLRSRRGLLGLRRILLVRAFERIAWNKLMKGNHLPGACARRQMGQELGYTCMVRHIHGGGVFLEPPQGVLQTTGSPVFLPVAQKPRSGVPANEDCNFGLSFVTQFDRTTRALEIKTTSLFGRLQLSCDGTTNLIHDNNPTSLQCLPQ